MVSTYSDILRLTLQGTGDNPNTWGDIANSGIFELIDDAIGGLETVNVTGTGDYVLSANNGAVDESRNAILVFTGTPGSGGRNVVIPGVSKLYVVKGDHTAETLTIKTTGSTDTVEVNPGDIKFIMCDGIEVLDVAGESGALLIANNLSDLNDVATARTNLGLTDTATYGIGDGLEVASSNIRVKLDGATLERSGTGMKATNATETQRGVAEIATQVEVDAGTDDEKFVTPLKLSNSRVIAQSLFDEYTATTQLSSLIPNSGSAPTTSHGTQILAVTITPTVIGSRIRITFQGKGHPSATGVSPCAIAFADNTFLKGSFSRTANNTTTFPVMVTLTTEITTTSLTPINITIRSGPAQYPGNIRWNDGTFGSSGQSATLVVEEIL